MVQINYPSNIGRISSICCTSKNIRTFRSGICHRNPCFQPKKLPLVFFLNTHSGLVYQFCEIINQITVPSLTLSFPCWHVLWLVLAACGCNSICCTAEVAPQHAILAPFNHSQVLPHLHLHCLKLFKMNKFALKIHQFVYNLKYGVVQISIWLGMLIIFCRSNQCNVRLFYQTSRVQ